ncbi:unnamed protein product [Caenorhabditis brenneri]
MPNRCKPSTSSVCPPDNSFDSEDGMPLLDVSLAESEGSREIPVVMPALVLKLTRDDSDGKPASLDEHSSPGVGPSGDLNLDDAMETDDGPYRDREFYMALETVDGIEETQLMSQCSVRKRDKKKRKSASDAARQAAKRLAESQEEREKRLESVAERDALRRSEMSEKERMIVNQRKRDKAAVARENESEEAANERREADAARTSARREAEDPESHAARNQDNAERTAAARANESPDETAARRLADRQRRSNDPKEFVPLAGTDDHPGAHYIGRMDNPCRHCGALYFRGTIVSRTLQSKMDLYYNNRNIYDDVFEDQRDPEYEILMAGDIEVQEEVQIQEDAHAQDVNLPIYTAQQVEDILSVERDYIDTKDLCLKISAELEGRNIPQALFATRIISRSQGTLSDLLGKPKPWEILRSGRNTFKRMYNWMVQPYETRMAILYGEPVGTVDVATPSQNKSKKRQSSSPGESSAKKPRLVFTECQKNTLVKVFEETQRPSFQMQKLIADHLHLHVSTVSNFFMNARRRRNRGARTSEEQNQE